MKRLKNNQRVQTVTHNAQGFFMQYGAVLIIGAALMFFCDLLHAKDLLGEALTGDIKDTIGSSGKFWKVFILFDVILAAAAAVKAKNPLVFGGVFMTAFIPAALLKAMVF